MAAFIELTWIVFLFSLCISLSKTTSVLKSYAIHLNALEDLAHNEYTVIKSFVNDPETTRALPVLKDIKKYVRDFTWSTGHVVKGGVNWTESWIKLQSKRAAENPIAGFSLISRTHKYWPRIFNETGEFELAEGIKSLKNFGWPDDDDLEEALQGIIVTTYNYELNVSEMALGKIAGISTGFKLNSGQCADLSWWSQKLNYMAMVVEWLELAIALKKPKISPKLEKRLKRQMLQHDEDMDAYDTDESPMFFEKKLQYYKACEDPGNTKTMDRYIGKCSTKPRRRNQFKCIRPENGEIPDWNVKYTDECFYSTLCSGKNYQTEAEKSRLFCWLEFAAHPYFHISPRKMEYLNRNPDIVQIYNVIDDNTIESVLKQVASGYKRRLNQTKIGDRELRPTLKRFVVLARINDTDESFGLRKLPREIEMLFGFQMLKPLSDETLQVGSYGLTGYYFRHDDANANLHGPLPQQEEMGDRLATFMYFLTDIKAGGSTPFLANGLAAPPIKGSAVFWYNIFSDVTGDDKVAHAGCPVLLGRKLIANKWIRAFNQWKSHPCPLNRKERYQILVNGKIPP